MKWGENEINDAIKMIENGDSFKDIADKLNRSHYSVSSKLNRLGYKSSYKPNKNKGKTKYDLYDWVTIQIEYDSGLSYEELKVKFGLSDRAMIWGKNNNKLKLRTISEGLKLAWKKGKFKNSDKEGLERYRQLCEFKFSINEYSDKFDFNLIKEYGWYKAKNRGDNPNGVSRDHMYSIKKGFEDDVDPYYISHPANCKLMRHSDNNKKKSKCSITLDELIERIKIWDS